MRCTRRQFLVLTGTSLDENSKKSSKVYLELAQVLVFG